MKPICTESADAMHALVASRLLCVLDGWQRGFPLVARPFAAIGRAMGLGESELLEGLSELQQSGVLGRVGATIRPNTVGVSMLAAMQVPKERLDEVARVVNSEPGVNHNYEREHLINLWFVIAAPDLVALDAALGRIRTATGLDIIELPLERAYYIDLGFSLGRPGGRDGKQLADEVRARGSVSAGPLRPEIESADRDVLTALERGLMLVARPYRALGAEVGLSEAEVIARIGRLIEAGVITRFGCIVRHRRLGYRANAMVVFDVEDRHVDGVGEMFAREDFVTLCYRRPRHGTRWPYNLFCMIHGQEREPVLDCVQRLVDLGGLGQRRQAVLFSRRCFLQRGTRIGVHSLVHQEAAQ